LNASYASASCAAPSPMLRGVHYVASAVRARGSRVTNRRTAMWVPRAFWTFTGAHDGRRKHVAPLNSMFIILSFIRAIRAIIISFNRPPSRILTRYASCISGFCNFNNVSVILLFRYSFTIYNNLCNITIPTPSLKLTESQCWDSRTLPCSCFYISCPKVNTRKWSSGTLRSPFSFFVPCVWYRRIPTRL